MWRGDGIQLAIDSGSLSATGGRVNTSCELGFALLPSGQVATYDWQGSFDWTSVTTRGVKTDAGYRLEITIPWADLALDPENLPPSIGLNLVVNDSGTGQHRFVEWTPGTAEAKNRTAFARAAFADSKAPVVGCLTLDHSDYDTKQPIYGQYVEYAPADFPAASLQLAAIPSQGERLTWPAVKLEELKKGQTQIIRFILPAATLGKEGDYKLQALTGEVGSTASQVTAVTPFQRLDIRTKVATELAALGQKFDDLKSQAATHPQSGQDLYYQMGLAVIDRFLGKLTGANSLAPEWQLLQAEELHEVLDKVEDELKNLDPRTENSNDKKGQGPSRQNSPATSTPPEYFYGYLGWQGITQDMAYFPKIGASLIQQERGPRDLKPEGGLTVSGLSITSLLDSAQAQGMKVDLLLSPHHFPEWAVQKAPEMKLEKPSGVIHFNIDHPLARQVIQDWIKTFVPLVQNHPALFSFCLTNEPTYSESGRDSYSRQSWIDYLAKKYANIDALNKLYESHYPSFDSVPVPPIEMPEKLTEQRAYYDWILFNQIHFAAWHQWMNDQVKALAPNIPTHAKVMTDIFDRASLARGVDPELFCGITDWAGNDSYAWPKPYRQYVYNWVQEEMWYDLLHSFRGQPVFNSENHFILDGTTSVHIPPEHTRAVLWQGALHHLKATTLWVWEEPSGNSPDLIGDIYLRPGNIYGAGEAMLDLRRLTGKVDEIAEKPAEMALIYSPTSIFWQPDYAEALMSAYTALNFMGQPVTFISERELVSHRRSPANDKIKWIILPRTTHTSNEVVAALGQFIKDKGKVIALGQDGLKYDEYQQSRDPATVPEGIDQLAWSKGKDEDLTSRMGALLSQQGLKIESVVDKETGKAAWGIEYRIVRKNGVTLVSLVNFLPQTKTISLELKSPGMDLLTGHYVDLSSITMKPLQPFLLQIKEDVAPPGTPR